MKVARMAEMHVSNDGDERLSAIGLGSCIGLALVDRSAKVAGLAHVVLPESGTMDGPDAKFADTVMPPLLDEVLKAGAARHRLEVAIVGGASMFSLGTQDIGARNEAAIRSTLGKHRLRIRAAVTGGTKGRTMHVDVGTGVVSVQEAGGKAEVILDREISRGARTDAGGKAR